MLKGKYYIKKMSFINLEEINNNEIYKPPTEWTKTKFDIGIYQFNYNSYFDGHVIEFNYKIRITKRTKKFLFYQVNNEAKIYKKIIKEFNNFEEYIMFKDDKFTNIYVSSLN